jgi:hypothetical protein
LISTGIAGPDPAAPTVRPSEDRFWRILLQKSFWGDKRNFLEPLMRFASGDANSGNERILGTFCVSAN